MPISVLYQVCLFLKFKWKQEKQVLCDHNKKNSWIVLSRFPLRKKRSGFLILNLIASTSFKRYAGHLNIMQIKFNFSKDPCLVVINLFLMLYYLSVSFTTTKKKLLSTKIHNMNI